MFAKVASINKIPTRYFLVLVAVSVLIALPEFAQAQLAPPEQEYVLRFAGEHTAIAPDDPKLDLGDNFTMAGWFYIEKIELGRVLMGRMSKPFYESFSAAYQVCMSNYDGSIEFQLSDGTSGYTFILYELPPVKEWIHIAAALDNGMMRLFVNGVEVGSESFSEIPSTQATRFSVGAGVTEEPEVVYQSGFTGCARQVSLWNIALDSALIQDLARNGATGSENGLIAYWKMEENTGDVVPDSGPNGLDMGFDQSLYEPEWRENDPIWYLTDAVSTPFFNLHEFPWYQPKNISGWTVQDIYPLDFDGDGLKDVVISYVAWPATIPATLTQLHALRNVGNNTFEDVTDQVIGNVDIVLARFGKVADLNGDGRDDIYLADSGSDTHPFPGRQNTLLLQSDDGRLLNKSTTNLPLKDNTNHGLSIGDIDNDGDLDIVQTSMANPGDISTYSPEVFLNSGDGNFSELYNSTLSQIGMAISCLLVDIDRDGDLELLMPVFLIYNRIALLENDGSGNFYFPNSGGLSANEFHHHPYSKNFQDIHAVDINGDGWLDILAAEMIGNYRGGRLVLFLNNKDGTFTHVEDAFQSPHLGPRDTNYWIIFLRLKDFNGDGWIDVYAEGQEAGDFLFLNDGEGGFTNVSFILSPRTNAWNSASAAFDSDNDGDIDIFSVSYGEIQVLENMRSYATAASPQLVPAAPALTEPLDGASTQNEVHFTWSENTPFPYSHLQVATDTEFNDLVFDRYNLTSLSFTVKDLEVDQTYYWRVKGINSAGGGEWSNTRSIFTEFAPPTNVTVSDVPEDHGHAMRLTWTLSAKDAELTYYYIYRSRSSVFSDETLAVESFESLDALIEAEETTTILVGSVTRGTSEYTDSGVPLNGVDYYYWVQSVSESGSSKPAPASIVTSVDEKSSAFKVSAPYPNPFNPTTTIEYSLPQDGHLILSIFNVSGQLVHVLKNELQQAGNYSITWNASEMPSGLYFCTLKSNGFTETRKMVLVR